MGNTMNSSILLTIKLKGKIGGPIKHVDKQVITVDVTPIGAKYSEHMTRKIKHNDRIESECSRKLRISEELVNSWEGVECPHWEKPNQWKSMSSIQRITSHVNRFDEGYGVTFDFLEGK